MILDLDLDGRLNQTKPIQSQSHCSCTASSDQGLGSWNVHSNSLIRLKIKLQFDSWNWLRDRHHNHMVRSTTLKIKTNKRMKTSECESKLTISHFEQVVKIDCRKGINIVRLVPQNFTSQPFEKVLKTSRNSQFCVRKRHSHFWFILRLQQKYSKKFLPVFFWSSWSALLRFKCNCLPSRFSLE